MGAKLPSEVIGPDIMFVDEAHHSVAPSWQTTIYRIQPRYLLGFSATPFRQDREPLSPKPFEKVIRPITPKELIDADILCPAIIESPAVYSLSGDAQRVNQASNLPQIYREAVRYAVSQGRSKILLYVSQTTEHTPLEIMKQTLEQIAQAGITVGHISQYHGAKTRGREIEKFQRRPGRIGADQLHRADRGDRPPDGGLRGAGTVQRKRGHHHTDDREGTEKASPEEGLLGPKLQRTPGHGRHHPLLETGRTQGKRRLQPEEPG